MKSWILLLFCPFYLQAQTIAEKKASFDTGCFLDPNLEYDLEETNLLLKELRDHQKYLYHQAYALFQENTSPELFEQITREIQETKKEIEELKSNWKKKSNNRKQEPYVLLHAPEMSLAEFIMEFVGDEAIFIIPPEIESMRLHVCSNFPLPKEGVEECLEAILAQYGIGIRKLSPYLSELFLTMTSRSGLDAILDDPQKLATLPPENRVCLILKEHDPKTALAFLRKFSNPQLTQVQLLGGHIFLISKVDALQELLKLLSFIQTKNTKQDLELISLSKIDPVEMTTILKMAFQDEIYGEDELNLKIYPLQSLPQTLVLAGSKEEIKRAKTIIEDLEIHIEDPEKNTLYWYNVKHSDPEELANVLSKIYQLLVASEVTSEKIDATIAEANAPTPRPAVYSQQVHANSLPAKQHHSTNFGNFVVDSKTSTIMMVVKQELLGEIKKLLEKLDVPKKMVQIEVLFFEKRIENQSKCGLNLLHIGSAIASSSGPSAIVKDGILNFFFSHGKSSNFPTCDLAFQFLLAQDDVQINASPSVITLNQTQASIDIVEEMSIDRGADDKKSSIFERAQYGINLKITPTINLEEQNDEGKAFITLDTKINFDTTNNSNSERPKVLRRQIQNLVRIADGETVILGGLRRKNQSEKKDSVPFLGEIPGLGKLFSMTGKNESTTEMFIFITPKIIFDPIEDNRKLTMESLKKRAGDLPEFLAAIDISKEKNKQKLFAQSLNALFDKMPNENRKIKGEYDGKE